MSFWTHDLDPVLLSFGSIQVRWYGLMYLVGYIAGYHLLKNRWKRGLFALNPEEIQILITYLMIGMMVGARLMYAYVYHEERAQMLSLTFEFFKFWQGISVVGLFIGVVAAVAIPNIILPVLGIGKRLSLKPQEWDLKKYWWAYGIGTLLISRYVYVSQNEAERFEYFFKIPAIWEGGLSYHGAVIGFVIAGILIGRKFGVTFYHVMDNVVVGGALGVFFGRLGNFINGELPGRVTDVPWAIIFPGYGSEPRHPSQLYQAFGEGLFVFFGILLLERFLRSKNLAPQPVYAIEGSKKEKPVVVRWNRVGMMCGSYLIFYGIARFVCEFFREPDQQLGYYLSFLSMGQILCILMILGGSGLLFARLRKPVGEEYKVTPAP